MYFTSPSLTLTNAIPDGILNIDTGIGNGIVVDGCARAVVELLVDPKVLSEQAASDVNRT